MPANFQTIYQRLNSAQRRAVDTVDGPVMVVAGPGTGKTQVLAARIAHILKTTDTAPGSILALTFTDVAATNMRERLFKMIGSTAFQVRIQTFHSFCNDVILAHPEYFQLQEDAEPISELELIEFLRNYFSNPQLEYLRTPRSAFHYLHAAQSALANIKKEGLTVTDFSQLVTEEVAQFEAEKSDLAKTKLDKAQQRVGKMQELADLYQAYQQYLTDHQRYDYEDMILWVAEAFDHQPSLLADYQEQLLYFLVDEYQDTNSAQNKILDQLAEFWGETANVFVVGDPNQTIYRFQGASLENVIGFVERYPQAELITLEQGYRCPQTIYTAAAEIIRAQVSESQISPALHTALSQPLAGQTPGKPIQLLEATTDAMEKVAIVEQIQHLIEKETPTDQIAILFRKNKEAQEFIDILKKWQLPYQLEKEENILESEFIRQFLTVLAAIRELQQGNEPVNLSEALLYDWMGLDQLAVLKLIHYQSRRQVTQTLFQLVQNEELPEGLDITADQFNHIQQKVLSLTQLAVRDLNLPFTEWLPEMIRALALDEWLSVTQPDPAKITQLNALYTEIESLVTSEPQLKLIRFLEIVEAMMAEHLSIQRTRLLGRRDGVVLSTAHGAKGKEWQHVFLVNCADKVWGNARTPHELPLPEKILRFQPETLADKNADDRRLFYVSLTRASQQVYLSYAQLNETTNRQQTMSMFVGDLISQDDLVEQWQPQISEAQTDLAAKLVLPSMPLPRDEEFKGWLHELVSDFRLSPTALNTYLKDPQLFLNQHLLKLPQVRSSALAFGTAMHAALEYAFRWKLIQHQFPSTDQIIEYFQAILAKEPLTESDYQARLKLGQRVLTDYLDQFDGEVNPVVLEHTFGRTGRVIQLDSDITLTGKVDRVDWIDQSSKTVKVIDYKTGRPQPRSKIEGSAYLSELSDREKKLPEPLRGPLKRQLLFYKLLSQLDSSFPGKVEFGELDFVEAVLKGKTGREVFELPQAEVDQLAELIRQVMAEIRALQFLE